MKMKKLRSPYLIPCRYERRDVYVITYLPTGKKYVGKSRNVKERFDGHYYALRGHRHNVKDFQRDYDKFGGGREAFKIEIIDCQLPFLNDRYDPEHMAMIKHKTYDARYGYNTDDPAVQWIREKNGLGRIWYGRYAKFHTEVTA